MITVQEAANQIVLEWIAEDNRLDAGACLSRAIEFRSTELIVAVIELCPECKEKPLKAQFDDDLVYLQIIAVAAKHHPDVRLELEHCLIGPEPLQYGFEMIANGIVSFDWKAAWKCVYNVNVCNARDHQPIAQNMGYELAKRGTLATIPIAAPLTDPISDGGKFDTMVSEWRDMISKKISTCRVLLLTWRRGAMRDFETKDMVRLVCDYILSRADLPTPEMLRSHNRLQKRARTE